MTVVTAVLAAAATWSPPAESRNVTPAQRELLILGARHDGATTRNLRSYQRWTG
jgi:hypothetical protein